MDRCTEWRGEHAAVTTNYVNYIDRLARYEDTGLAPEDIQEVVDLLAGFDMDVPKEVKSWAARCTWHVKKCAELDRQLEQAREQLKAKDLLLAEARRQAQPGMETGEIIAGLEDIARDRRSFFNTEPDEWDAQFRADERTLQAAVKAMRNASEAAGITAAALTSIERALALLTAQPPGKDGGEQ